MGVHWELSRQPRQQLLPLLLLLLLLWDNPSPTRAGLSTNKKELERAAELAVERAAERAAERAVEKALNSGNSSTVTVTLKESYKNARRTAEESAAPGSESTRPNLTSSKSNATTGRHEYAHLHAPASQRSYEVREEQASTDSVESESSTDFESIKSPSLEVDGADDSDDSIDEEVVEELLLQQQPDGFGMKEGGGNSRTRTLSRSKLKKGQIEDVDEDEGERLLAMYAGSSGGQRVKGWSSARQKGWVRHRPLWDDADSLLDDDIGKVPQSRRYWNEPVSSSSSSSSWTAVTPRQIRRSQRQLGSMIPPLSRDSIYGSVYQMLQKEAVRRPVVVHAAMQPAPRQQRQVGEEKIERLTEVPMNHRTSPRIRVQKRKIDGKALAGGVNGVRDSDGNSSVAKYERPAMPDPIQESNEESRDSTHITP